VPNRLVSFVCSIFSESIVLLLSAAISCSVTPLQAAHFQNLGYFPGFTEPVIASGISANGEVVVGRVGYNQPGGRLAFKWSRDAGYAIVAGSVAGPAGVLNNARATSVDGSVVIGSLQLPSGAERAMRWDSVNGTQNLGFLPNNPGSARSLATDVSGDGRTIVGGSGEYFFNYVQMPFIWNAEDGMRPVAGGELRSGIATAISNDGKVVIGGGSSADGLRNGGFWWSEADGLNFIGDLPGGLTSAAPLDLSRNGETIVGHSNSANGKEAFLWRKSGQIIGLGDLPGGRFSSEALSVSGDGTIVVGKSEKEGNETAAFIWDERNGLRDLRTWFIQEHGLSHQLNGWKLEDAFISLDGRVIAGTGSLSSVGTAAWIFVVPEPSSAFFSGGILFVLTRRWRFKSPR
jgi:uncharacterized membrane protein